MIIYLFSVAIFKFCLKERGFIVPCDRARRIQFQSLGCSESVVRDIVKLVYLLLMKKFHAEMSKREPN
jgi:hypothetical protein